ncbi:Ig-like domain-containing protein [Phycicoccus duodecadis]|uniref:HD domain-containing protein n=1 Tax=Phycicoccus duodecadis TaxID=173053 RepID=A0A2N3YKP3_9MICO|nr:tandem-95 repeat protein [Phycicoccus duodecadis]PKW27437.1 HD domain-containing protein [Phycicoccus duodecadis]
MTRAQKTDSRQWQPHPVRAAALRALAFALPLVVSIGVGILVGALMPVPSSTSTLVLWWAAVLSSSTVAVYAADRVTRRVLPLATLMRLSILFPDRAPSRLKVARKVSGSRAIAAELARAGMASDRQEAAETILALVGALGDYDARTRGHSERTQLFVTMLADELRLSNEDKGKLMWAALVHDIGKLKVPHSILNKPAAPTADEWEVLHSHPHHGAEICEPLREWLGPWWLAIEQHHEKYDGSGYPHALAGREISYGARIVAVADSYEVMTASRPYKRPMTALAARAELTACAGSHFDPDIVRAFLNISLGGLRRSIGPLAWLAQILMVRPGPILGQVLGVAAGAVGAAAAIVGLNLAPGIASAEPLTTAHPTPAVAAPSPTRGTPTPTPTPAPRATRPTAPQRTGPAEPGPSPVTPPASPSVAAPQPTIPPTVTPSPAPGLFVLADDTGSTLEDTPHTFDLLANDIVDGPVEVVAVSDPARGSAAVVGGRVVYTPDPDVNGTERFGYTVRDSLARLRTAQVTVEVIAVDDAPVATPDAVSLAEDSGTTTLSGLLANDTDAEDDTLTVTAVTGAAHGTVAEPTAGVFTYTPQPDFAGAETLSYDISDGNGGTAAGTVAVTVAPVNDAPVANADALTVLEDAAASTLDLVSNDVDVDGDPLTVTVVSGAVHGTLGEASPGVWAYTPDPDWNGTESLSYDISDGNGGTASGTVAVTVAPVNDAPVANADALTVLEDAAASTLDLVSNDVDVEGDLLTVTAVSGAVHGTLGETSPGVWAYTPDPDFAGAETLSYDISDGNGGTATGTMTVTVTPVNDAPVSGPDAFAVTVGQTLSTTASDGVLANDSDVDGDPLTVTGDDSLVVDINPDGSFTYTGLAPATEVVGYTVSDGQGGTSSGTLTITVTLLPSSVMDLYLQPVDTLSTGALSTAPPGNGIGDYDADGNPGLTIKPSDMKPTETDPLKYQEWGYAVPSGGLTMNGPLTMDLWTSLKNQAGKDLDYASWVYDCTAPSTCSLIASTVNVHVSKWSTTTTWEEHTVTVGSADTTVPAGHTIKVRLAFNHTDVWMPLDTAHPSSLTYSQ